MKQQVGIDIQEGLFLQGVGLVTLQEVHEVTDSCRIPILDTYLLVGMWLHLFTLLS